MIVRIVKMSFIPEKVTEFLNVFNQHSSAIANAEGCIDLQLIQNNNSATFFTISKWQSEQDLENYRQSELFAIVWPQTKALFNQKAEAWTNNVLFSK